MARARRSLDERIEEQKQVVSKAREHYEAEVNKLEQMMNKRDELQKKELDLLYRDMMDFVNKRKAETNSLFPKHDGGRPR